MFDFIDDVIEFVGDLLDLGADEVIDNVDTDILTDIGADEVVDTSIPDYDYNPSENLDTSGNEVSFQGSPSRKGSCYDCGCEAFIPQPGKPTTCICGHSIGRHHIYLGH